MAKIAHYSPEDVTVLIAGVLEVKGYVDGTFVTIEKDDAPYESQKTADGRVARLSNSDQTYQVTLTIHSLSEFNSILTNVWLVDEVTGQGKFPLMIKDNLGNSLFFSGTAWISVIPDINYSTEVTDRKWTITATQCSNYLGGNESRAGLLKSLITGLAGSAQEINNSFR